MTLQEIVNSFLSIAKNTPNVGYVGEGDVFSISTLPSVDYGVFYVTQTQHSQSEDIMNYTLTLYYIDRLTSDKSNKLQIQSNGIVTLGNIINLFQMKNDVDVQYDIQYVTFTQRFSDECAGVFCTITISTENPVGLCGFEF